MDSRAFEDRTEGYNVEVMDYAGLEDVTALELDNISTVNIREAETGYREDGTRVYVKNAEAYGDDIVQSHIAASIVGEHMDVLNPDISYDDTYGKILIEEMPGKIFEPGRKEYDTVHSGLLHQAVAQKLLIGDIDYAGNILITGGGTVSPVDYDSTGRDLATSKITLNSTELTNYLNGDRLHREASRLAQQIDIQALEEDLRGEEWLEEEWCDGEEEHDPVVWQGLLEGSIENILHNIRVFQK